jgi:hypothetical protein
VGGVDFAIRSGSDIVIGCNGGRVVRIDVASGRIRAQSNEFSVEQISGIAPLSSCAFGVSGWSSGAIIVTYAEIIGCKRLNQIVPKRMDTSVLGSVSDSAVLDDMRCNGRPGVYRPATIFRADLVTGALSPEVDLTRNPIGTPRTSAPPGRVP